MIDLRHYYIKHKKILSGIAFAILIALIFYTVNNPAIVGAAATTRQLPIYSVGREDNCISISFDAAWGNEDTQKLIDVLESYGVKTTFFVVGDWVDKYPESVKALSDAGHEVMNHSSSHAHFSQLSDGEIVADVSKCNDKIEAITGKKPVLFRCPYGEYDDHVIAAINSMGMKAIQWDVDSLDWKGISADEIAKRVTENVRSGSIVLFHNAADNTPEALPKILETLINKGFKIVPISELIYYDNYSMDHTGKQISN